MHEINTYSPNRWNATLIFTIVSTIGLLLFLTKKIENFGIAALTSILIGVLLIWIGFRSYKARIIIQISDNELEIKWTKNYLVLPRKDLNIEFKNLESWIFDSWDKYRLLKLKLLTGKTIYFTFIPADNSNYFEFEKHLTNKINEINALPYKSKIKTGKNWYQTPLAKVLLILLFIASIWLCLDVISNKKFTVKGIFSMAFMIANFGLYGFKMYLENWKLKK